MTRPIAFSVATMLILGMGASVDNMSDDDEQKLPPYSPEEKIRDLLMIIQVQREQIERLKRTLREAGVKGF